LPDIPYVVYTDINQGDGVAIRMNPNAAKASSPIASLDSEDMACSRFFYISLSDATLTIDP
jgi:hypothetical protein